MTLSKPTRRTCPNGHSYFKSSDCPVCPVCEKEKVPETAFLTLLVAPARRALEQEGIKSLQVLSQYSEAQLLKLHGFGPGSLPTLRKVLQAHNLHFAE